MQFTTAFFASLALVIAQGTAVLAQVTVGPTCSSITCDTGYTCAQLVPLILAVSSHETC